MAIPRDLVHQPGDGTVMYWTERLRAMFDNMGSPDAVMNFASRIVTARQSALEDLVASSVPDVSEDFRAVMLAAVALAEEKGVTIW